jgi:hypothetical protein
MIVKQFAEQISIGTFVFGSVDAKDLPVAA